MKTTLKRYPGKGNPEQIREIRYHSKYSPESLRYTIKLIGDGIKSGTGYLPIRQWAAGIATTALPRDFTGQVAAIYDEFVNNRWRYVFDPVGYEMVAVKDNVISDTVLGLAPRPKNQRGFGDCDDATVAMGAALQNIGFPVRIATIAAPRSLGLFDHVFLQAKIPKLGWVSVDPVGHPHRKLGWTAPHKRIAWWNLDGKLIAARGEFTGRNKKAFKRMVARAA